MFWPVMNSLPPASRYACNWPMLSDPLVRGVAPVRHGPDHHAARVLVEDGAARLPAEPVSQVS